MGFSIFNPTDYTYFDKGPNTINTLNKTDQEGAPIKDRNTLSYNKY